MFVHCEWLILIHFVDFCIFVGQPVVTVIMIDSSEICKLLVQRPYVTERCSNESFPFNILTKVLPDATLSYEEKPACIHGINFIW